MCIRDRSRTQSEAFSKLKEKYVSQENGFRDVVDDYYQLSDARIQFNESEFFEDRLKLKRGYLKGLNGEDIIEGFASYADTMQALSRGMVGFGHSKMYWAIPTNAEAEFFAHAMENRFLGNPIFEHFDKSLYNEMVKMVDELLESNGI